jgi:rieske iron-sulfur protein
MRLGPLDECTGRRALLKAGVGLGIELTLAQVSPAEDNPATIRPREGDLFVRDEDSSASPLTPDDIPLGGPQIMAWPMDPATKTLRSGTRFNRVMLVRLDAAQLTDETRSRAADSVVAYTAICTHSGCEVVDWTSDAQQLVCACHNSRFDPRDGGKVVDGPAPRRLPALPLKIVEGKLVVAKPFTARIGFVQD